MQGTRRERGGDRLLQWGGRPGGRDPRACCRRSAQRPREGRPSTGTRRAVRALGPAAPPLVQCDRCDHCCWAASTPPLVGLLAAGRSPHCTPFGSKAAHRAIGALFCATHNESGSPDRPAVGAVHPGVHQAQPLDSRRRGAPAGRGVRGQHRSPPVRALGIAGAPGVHGCSHARAVGPVGALPHTLRPLGLTRALVHACWHPRRQQQAARSNSTRAAAGGVQQRVMAAASAKGKALISVSDKTGLDALAKVGSRRGLPRGVRHCTPSLQVGSGGRPWAVHACHAAQACCVAAPLAGGPAVVTRCRRAWRSWATRLCPPAAAPPPLRRRACL